LAFERALNKLFGLGDFSVASGHIYHTTRFRQLTVVELDAVASWFSYWTFGLGDGLVCFELKNGQKVWQNDIDGKLSVLVRSLLPPCEVTIPFD
jgi:hypothetical protein